jgi:RHS repeat-associated protein
VRFAILPFYSYEFCNSLYIVHRSRLVNAGRNRILGPSRSQEVQQGDSVELSVYGKYVDPRKRRLHPASFVRTGANTRMIQQLAEYGQNLRAAGPNEVAIANVIALVIGELETKPVPEAYMGYALGACPDESSDIGNADSNRYETGKVVLSKKARNRHEELSKKIAVKEDGYIETYLVNETEENVWFDQFSILSTGPLIVQETHYDPWGVELSGLGYQYGGIKVNPYLYNGIEHIEDLNLNVYSAAYRNYDPVIGRWWQIDPYDKEDMSPYAWVTNNPILYADPLGLDSVRYDDLNKVPFDPKNDIVLLEEVTVTASYTGPKATDSPNVRYALRYYNPDRPLSTGAVEPFYFTPNPVEAAISVTDNLSRGEFLMAGMAGIALIPGGKTMRGVVKAAGLPISGKIRFIPPNAWNASQPLRKGPKGGYLDRFGNEWTKKKVAGKGPGEIHWDVQLSPTGKSQLGHLSNSGNHLNVTSTGQIAH